MKPYSLQKRMVAAVLLLETVSLVAFVLLALFHEGRTRFRAFDQMLQSNAATLFGAVEDADDIHDNVMLESKGLRFPKRDFFEVQDIQGRILGRSSVWPEQQIDMAAPVDSPDGRYAARIDGKRYRFVVLHAVRLIDPGAPGGGTPRPVTVRYGAPMEPVLHGIAEAVLYYSSISLILVVLTGVGLTWILRRGLQPLVALAHEADRITPLNWDFNAPAQAKRIAELKPLTDALQLTLSRLRSSFEQQRRLTSDAAHELKTGVAITKSSVQLLGMLPRSPEEYRTGLETCLNDILRLEEVVAKMLTLARVEQTAEEAIEPRTPVICDGASALRSAGEQLQAIATLQRVDLTLHAPSDARVPMAVDDFSLICVNLLLNALQHSRPGGWVQGELAVHEKDLNLTIADNGTGIPEEALPHIFEPFFRSEAARDRKSGGTGLGLAICKVLIEAKGGTISVSSEYGKGTEVRVLLPAQILHASFSDA